VKYNKTLAINCWKKLFYWPQKCRSRGVVF